MNSFWEARFGTKGFLNEDLWPGHFGHLSILLSFIALIAAFVYYFIAETNRADAQKSKVWIRFGRIAFCIHGAAVLISFSVLFWIILKHKFEYYYAWRHSSLDLPLKYMISCFWEGQEGSFLLWEFWHFILGLILIFRSKLWESGVMMVLVFVQLVLASMLLGIGFGEIKIGINPFVLLREMMTNAPIFTRPNYLQFIQDGNGLNALLQNYWMTIHPPVLFLGFASTTIPLTYAIAGLWRKDHKNWVAPALPWASFSVGILGAGILMGGAWAYESLSFGGFWAWDPVENASLVPWLLMVAGLHVLLIYRHSGHSLSFGYAFVILSFFFVIYSTYLTRSGVLGESSVHSFTDEGLNIQLLVMLGLLSIPMIVLLIIRIPGIPSTKSEEDILSREFWMFIGSLFLLLSAVLITFTTSIPVWNLLFWESLFKQKIAQPADPIQHYNLSQVWIGLLIAILSGLTQYLHYKTAKIRAITGLLVSVFLSMIFTLIIAFTYKPVYFPYLLLLFTGSFSVISNLAYMISIQRKNWLTWGGSLAHIGFALILIAVVISQHKQEAISVNVENLDFGDGFKQEDKKVNRLLFQNAPIKMADYRVTYLDKDVNEGKTFFKIKFEKLSKEGKVIDSFTLSPFMQQNGKSTDLVSNPDTKHYLSQDIFTNVSSFSNDKIEEGKTNIDTMAVGDSMFTSSCLVYFDSLVGNPSSDSFIQAPNVLAVGALLRMNDMVGKIESGMPVYVIDMQSGMVTGSYAYNNWNKGLSFTIEKILPEQEKVVFSWREVKKPQSFVIMRAIVFPWINLVWLGSILMTLGGFLSAFNRRSRTLQKAS